MKLKHLSIKKLCRLVGAGMLISMLFITSITYAIADDVRMLMGGVALTVCAFIWLFLFIKLFGKRLSVFTDDLCLILDKMIHSGTEPEQVNDSKALFDRIRHRLSRLYDIMQENRRKVDEERQELQMLISDISHQVKHRLQISKW